MKICPLLLGRGYNHDCKGGSCAWWCEFAKDCSIPVVAGILADSSICQNIFDAKRPLEDRDFFEVGR